MKDAARVLGRKGWLSETPESFQQALLSRCDQIRLRSGDPVYRHGETVGGIFGIVTGRVEFHLPHLKEGRSLCHVAGAGNWFGDLAAVSGNARRFEVRAREESILVRLSRAEMMRLVEDRPDAWKYVAGLLASNLAVTLDYVEATKSQRSLARVRAVLRYLVRHGGGEPDALNISQDDLAAISGLSRKSTNSAVKQLEAAGEITISYRSIRVNH